MTNNSNKQETAYISKYALTFGIIVCNNGSFTESGGYTGKLLASKLVAWFSKKEAYQTLEEALADGETRRLKKIEALKKQIKRLEELKIKVKK